MQSNRFTCTGPSVEINALRVFWEYLALDSYSKMHSGFQIMCLWAYTSVKDSKLSSCWHDDRREWVSSCASVAVLCVGPPSALDHLQSDILKGRSAHVIVLHKSLWWLFSAFRSLFLFSYSVRSDFFVCFTIFFKQSLKGPPLYNQPPLSPPPCQANRPLRFGKKVI